MKKWTAAEIAAHEETQARLFDRASVASFVHPADLIDAANDGDPSHGGAELVLRILAWISSRAKRADTWGTRAWVAAYYLRPELTRGISAAEFAAQCGITRQAMALLLAEWRAAFPEITWQDGRARNCRSARRTPPGEGTSTPRRSRPEVPTTA